MRWCPTKRNNSGLCSAASWRVSPVPGLAWTVGTSVWLRKASTEKGRWKIWQVEEGCWSGGFMWYTQWPNLSTWISKSHSRCWFSEIYSCEKKYAEDWGNQILLVWQKPWVSLGGKIPPTRDDSIKLQVENVAIGSNISESTRWWFTFPVTPWPLRGVFFRGLPLYKIWYNRPRIVSHYELAIIQPYTT